MKLSIDPRFLPALRATIALYGCVPLDAKTLRVMHGVGRHGSLVSADIEKDLRSRGFRVWPSFSVRSQQDVVLICRPNIPDATLERFKPALKILQMLTTDERSLLWWTDNAERLEAKLPMLVPTLRLHREIRARPEIQ